MALQGQTVWFLVIVAAISPLFYKLYMYGMRPKGYPPGPPTLPIIGNLHQLPPTDIHLQFQQWTKQYGPVVSLKLGGQTVILLGTAEAVKDLLEKRSNIYSTRMDTFYRYFGRDLGISHRSNDEIWKGMRRVYHTRLSGKASDNYLPYLTFESLQLLSDLIDKPTQLKNNLERYTTSIASTIAYGRRMPSANVQDLKDLDAYFSRSVVAGGLVGAADWFPFLRPLFIYAPSRINPLRRELETIARLEQGLWPRLARRVRATMQAGKTFPSFMRDMYIKLDSAEKGGLNEEQSQFNAGHAWAAGTDTQANTLRGFVKAMVLYPEAQEQAQLEIDAVVGSDRLPEWGDREKLPFVRGVIEETLRWMPTTVTGGPMPHCVSRDDEYMGYKIPAGAGIVNCVWTINNDENRFPNPRKFDPTRFDATDSALDGFGLSGDISKRPHFTFGAGRRVCPGFYAAERGIFIAVSRLLWAFRFTHKQDAHGHPIPIEHEAFTPGLVVAPLPFEYDVKPRDAGRTAMVRKLWADANQQLDVDGNYTEEFFTSAWTAKLQ